MTRMRLALRIPGKRMEYFSHLMVGHMTISPDCNFIFLEEDYPYLAEGACIAESCIYTDPHNTIMKIGLLNEEICRLICKESNIEIGKRENLAQIVHKLKKCFFTDEDAETCMKIKEIADNRNKAAHNLPRTEKWHRKYIQIAEQSVQAGYAISVNFYSRFVNPDYPFPPYHVPGKQPAKTPKDETCLDNTRLKHENLHEEAVRKDDRDDDGMLGPVGKKIATGAAIGAGLLAAPFLLPIIGATAAGAITTAGGAGIASKGIRIVGGAALAVNGILKTRGILPDSVNKFFGSLDMSDLDIEDDRA